MDAPTAHPLSANLLLPCAYARVDGIICQPRPGGPGCTSFYDGLPSADRAVCIERMPALFHSADPDESRLAEAQEFSMYTASPSERRIAGQWITACLRESQAAREPIPWQLYPLCSAWVSDNMDGAGAPSDAVLPKVQSFREHLAEIGRMVMMVRPEDITRDIGAVDQSSWAAEGARFFESLLEIVMQQDRGGDDKEEGAAKKRAKTAATSAITTPAAPRPYGSFFYMSLTEREQRACESLPMFFHAVDPCDDFIFCAIRHLGCMGDNPAGMAVAKRWIRDRLQWKEFELRRPDSGKYVLCSAIYMRNEERARSRVGVPRTPFVDMLWAAIERRRMEPRFIREGIRFMKEWAVCAPPDGGMAARVPYESAARALVQARQPADTTPPPAPAVAPVAAPQPPALGESDDDILLLDTFVHIDIGCEDCT